MLLAAELDELEHWLSKLLNDEIKEPKEIEFAEPDFSFILYPKKDLREDPRYAYVAPDYEIEDIYAEWRVYFWNGGITENFFSIHLYRVDIEDLVTYLRTVQGILHKTDEEVQRRIQRGVFNPRYGERRV